MHFKYSTIMSFLWLFHIQLLIYLVYSGAILAWMWQVSMYVQMAFKRKKTYYNVRYRIEYAVCSFWASYYPHSLLHFVIDYHQCNPYPIHATHLGAIPTTYITRFVWYSEYNPTLIWSQPRSRCTLYKLFCWAKKRQFIVFGFGNDNEENWIVTSTKLGLEQIFKFINTFKKSMKIHIILFSFLNAIPKNNLIETNTKNSYKYL